MGRMAVKRDSVNNRYKSFLFIGALLSVLSIAGIKAKVSFSITYGKKRESCPMQKGLPVGFIMLKYR